MYRGPRARGGSAWGQPQEAAEAIGVTFLMNGGPATVYGARAFAAVQEFYSERISAPSGASARH